MARIGYLVRLRVDLHLADHHAIHARVSPLDPQVKATIPPL
jgi:hypothetical protein